MSTAKIVLLVVYAVLVGLALMQGDSECWNMVVATIGDSCSGAPNRSCSLFQSL